MIRLGLVLWAALHLTACGNYFYDEINATPVEIVPIITTPVEPETPPEGKTTSTSTVFAGVYDGEDTDEAVSVVTTSDGGYMVAGNTRSHGAGGRDIILLKLDQYGNMQWQKTMGGTKDDTVRSMIKTGGGFVILGETSSFGNGDVDLWVIRINENGNIEWEKTIGGTSTERAGGIVEGENGCLVIGASTKSFGRGNSDMWFLQLSSLGALENKHLEGDVDDDVIEGVYRNSDGNFLFYGYTDHKFQGHYDGFLYETDHGLDLNFGAAITGGENYYIRALCQAPDKGYVAVVEAYDYNFYTKAIMVVKFDYRMWSFEWQKLISGNGNSYGKITISADATHFIIGGSTRAYGSGDYDFWFIDMDYTGKVLRQKTIGHSGVDYLHGMCDNGRGGYLLAGYTTSFGIGSTGMLLASIDGTNVINGSLVTIKDTEASIATSTARYKSFEFPIYSISYDLDAANSNAIVKMSGMTQRFY